MAKITYEDKVDVLVSSLPNKNKINAGDMNQIKNSVNELETDIANGLSEAKIYTDTKIDQLEIGCANLLLNTQKPSGYLVNGVLTSEIYKCCYVGTANNTSGSGTIDFARWMNAFLPTPDTEYTLSFWAKGSGAIQSYFYSSEATVTLGYSNHGATAVDNEGKIKHTLTNDWIKYIITWKTLSKVSEKKHIIPCRVMAGGNLTGICAFKFEEGNKSTGWTPAPEDLISEAKTYADTKIDQLEIGGRNYIPLSSLRNTISYDSFSKSTGLCTVVDGEYAVVERTTIATARGGIYKNIYFTDYFQIGDTVTLSAEIYIDSLGEGTQNGSIFMRSYKASNESSTLKDLCNTLIDSSCAKGKWIRVSSTETITNTDTLFSKMQVQIMCGYGIAKFKVRNLKFEIGNKATDWSPAPEDLVGEAKTYADTKADSLVIDGRNYFRYGLTSTLTVNIPSLISQTGSWGAEVVSNTNLQLMLDPSTTYRIRYKFKLDSKIANSIPNAATDHGTLLIYSGVSSYPVIYLNDNRANNSTEAKNWVIGSVVERKAVFTTPANMDSTTSYRMLAYTLRETDSAGNVLANSKGTFFDIKIEKGDKYTGWSLAPEDMGSAIDLYNTTIDINDFNFAKGYKQGIWACRSDGGTTNIANLPKKSAFLLKLETMRFVGTTDYRQSQTIIYGVSGECYIRWGTETGWSDWVLTAVKGVPMLEDSGWITPTLINSFTVYGGLAENQPQYRKVGKIVELVGAISPPASNTVGTNTQTAFCTLPVGFRPSKIHSYTMQGSGQYQWLLTVGTSGNVLASRYSLGGVLTAPISTSWLPFNVTFFVD